MEHSVGSTLCLLVLAILANQRCQCQDLIGPSPSQAALIGQTVTTLTCSKASTVPNLLSWFYVPDTGENIQLYVGTTKLSFETKYDNFGVVSDTEEQLDLQITDIAVEDEGTYSCQIAGLPTAAQVILTVEVQHLSVDMTQDGSGTTLVTVTAGEPSEIKCTANGARPAVTIDWYHTKDGGSETEITDGVSQVDTPNADDADTTDSVSTLNYTATKDYNGGELRCETTGQEVAESRQDKASLNVQFTPEPVVEFNGNDEITCKSTANPTVVESGYVIILNGTILYPPTAPLSCADGICTLVVDITFPTDVRCNATNAVGTGSASTEAVPGITPSPAPATEGSTTKDNGGSGDGPNTAAIIGGVFAGIVIIAIIIAGLVYWFVVRPKGKGNTSKNSSEMRPVNNGSGDSAKPKPVAAPRSSTGNAHDNEEGKKKQANDNPDGLLYAELEHNKKPGRPDSGNNGNNIIRTEEPTQYADVKTFITQPPSPT